MSRPVRARRCRRSRCARGRTGCRSRPPSRPAAAVGVAERQRGVVASRPSRAIERDVGLRIACRRSSASERVPSWNTTSILSTSSTTWLLVTMKPSSEITKPVPRLGTVKRRGAGGPSGERRFREPAGMAEQAAEQLAERSEIGRVDGLLGVDVHHAGRDRAREDREARVPAVPCEHAVGQMHRARRMRRRRYACLTSDYAIHVPWAGLVTAPVNGPIPRCAGRARSWRAPSGDRLPPRACSDCRWPAIGGGDPSERRGIARSGISDWSV